LQGDFGQDMTEYKPKIKEMVEQLVQAATHREQAAVQQADETAEQLKSTLDRSKNTVKNLAKGIFCNLQIMESEIESAKKTFTLIRPRLNDVKESLKDPRHSRYGAKKALEKMMKQCARVQLQMDMMPSTFSPEPLVQKKRKCPSGPTKSPKQIKPTKAAKPAAKAAAAAKPAATKPGTGSARHPVPEPHRVQEEPPSRECTHTEHVFEPETRPSTSIAHLLYTRDNAGAAARNASLNIDCAPTLHA
jgi:hypothetical protein